MSNLTPNVQTGNHFVRTGKGRGRPKAGIPYKIQNGNFGAYLPKNFFGATTLGSKMVIDLKTKKLRPALERIEALGLMVRMSTCKKETF